MNVDVSNTFTHEHSQSFCHLVVAKAGMKGKPLTNSAILPQLAPAFEPGTVAMAKTFHRPILFPRNHRWQPLMENV